MERNDPKEYVCKGGKIEFKNVHFSFKPQKKDAKYLFKDLNLVIEPHKQTALVGPSGFGKTTIFNLIVILISS